MAKINSRQKGAAAERELISELRGYLGDEFTSTMKRNLEQSRKGGHDIAGVHGWAIEVKRYKALSESDLTRFWERQVIEQAVKAKARPALAYKGDYRPWRVRVPIALVRDLDSDWQMDHGGVCAWTADISLEAFSSMLREVHSNMVLRSVVLPATL